MLNAWFASLVGGTGYLGLTLYVLFGLGMLCADSAVSTGSLLNLAIIVGYVGVFAVVWFVAPPNPLVKALYELGAVALFLLEMLIVTAFGALVYLFDGRVAPLGC